MASILAPFTATAVATNVSTETAALSVNVPGSDTVNAPFTGAPAPTNTVKYLINGSLNITPGTSTTAVVVKCRQGQSTVTGTQVGPSITVGVTAGVNASIPFMFQDAAPAVPTEDYTITVTQTAGTVAGTVNYIAATAQTDY